MDNTQAMGVYSRTRIYPETDFNVMPEGEALKGFEIPFNSNTVSSSQNSTTPGTISGRRDVMEPVLGNVDVAGDIVVPLDLNAFGYVLAMAFGKPDTTPSADKSGLYTHVFKAGKTQPSFAIEKVFSNGIYSLINGAKVNQIETTIGGDGELTATVGIMGCKESLNDAAAAADSAITAVALNRLNNFHTALMIGGEDTAIATEISLTLPFGLDDGGYAIGSKGYRTRLNEGLISPTGQLTAFFDNKEFVEKAINSTVTSIKITAAKGTGSLAIEMPKVMFARNTPGIEGATGITQQLDYSAFATSDDQTPCIQFTLVNNVETYPF